MDGVVWYGIRYEMARYDTYHICLGHDLSLSVGRSVDLDRDG